MTPARRRAFLFCLLALLISALLIVASRQERAAGSARPRNRPTLMLLTSLPIVFNEGFSLSGGGSPVLRRLSNSYRVVPISVTSPAELSRGKLLLMAHASSQAAENLVALDAWVRKGGRVLILADPLLEWPSKRPLGDRLRPSPMFMDTGLLAHWGLTLGAPDKRGAEVRRLGSYRVVTVSPGYLKGTCNIGTGGLDADCRVGNGRAIVIADADFLNTPALGDEASHNLDALMEELARLRAS